MEEMNNPIFKVLEELDSRLSPTECRGFDPKDTVILGSLREAIVEIAKSPCANCYFLVGLGNRAISATLDYLIGVHEAICVNAIDPLKITLTPTETGLFVDLNPPQNPKEVLEARQSQAHELEKLSQIADVTVNALLQHIRGCQGPVILKAVSDSRLYTAEVCASNELVDKGPFSARSETFNLNGI